MEKINLDKLNELEKKGIIDSRSASDLRNLTEQGVTVNWSNDGSTYEYVGKEGYSYSGDTGRGTKKGLFRGANKAHRNISDAMEKLRGMGGFDSTELVQRSVDSTGGTDKKATDVEEAKNKGMSEAEIAKLFPEIDWTVPEIDIHTPKGGSSNAPKIAKLTPKAPSYTDNSFRTYLANEGDGFMGWLGEATGLKDKQTPEEKTQLAARLRDSGITFPSLEYNATESQIKEAYAVYSSELQRLNIGANDSFFDNFKDFSAENYVQFKDKVRKGDYANVTQDPNTPYSIEAPEYVGGYLGENMGVGNILRALGIDTHPGDYSAITEVVGGLGDDFAIGPVKGAAAFNIGKPGSSAAKLTAQRIVAEDLAKSGIVNRMGNTGKNLGKVYKAVKNTGKNIKKVKTKAVDAVKDATKGTRDAYHSARTGYKDYGASVKWTKPGPTSGWGNSGSSMNWTVPGKSVPWTKPGLHQTWTPGQSFKPTLEQLFGYNKLPFKLPTQHVPTFSPALKRGGKLVRKFAHGGGLKRPPKKTGKPVWPKDLFVPGSVPGNTITHNKLMPKYQNGDLINGPIPEFNFKPGKDFSIPRQTISGVKLDQTGANLNMSGTIDPVTKINDPYTDLITSKKLRRKVDRRNNVDNSRNKLPTNPSPTYDYASVPGIGDFGYGDIASAGIKAATTRKPDFASASLQPHQDIPEQEGVLERGITGESMLASERQQANIQAQGDTTSDALVNRQDDLSRSIEANKIQGQTRLDNENALRGQEDINRDTRNVNLIAKGETQRLNEDLGHTQSMIDTSVANAQMGADNQFLASMGNLAIGEIQRAGYNKDVSNANNRTEIDRIEAAAIADLETSGELPTSYAYQKKLYDIRAKAKFDRSKHTIPEGVTYSS